MCRPFSQRVRGAQGAIKSIGLKGTHGVLYLKQISLHFDHFGAILENEQQTKKKYMLQGQGPNRLSSRGPDLHACPSKSGRVRWFHFALGHLSQPPIVPK